MAYSIRTFGDPVLKSKAAPITDVDGKLVRLVDDMFTTLYDSGNGIALAAPQIGVQKQIFVWDFGEGDQQVIFNPEIVDSDGEWVYDEGCKPWRSKELMERHEFRTHLGKTVLHT